MEYKITKAQQLNIVLQPSISNKGQSLAGSKDADMRSFFGKC